MTSFHKAVQAQARWVKLNGFLHIFKFKDAFPSNVQLDRCQLPVSIYLSSRYTVISLWPRKVARWTGDQPSLFVLLTSAPNSTNSFADSILPSLIHWCSGVSPASFKALILTPILSNRWISWRSLLLTASWNAFWFCLVSFNDVEPTFWLTDECKKRE